MNLKALIFDFDGLILDTETPRYKTWKYTYRLLGQKFDFNLYSKTIGKDHRCINLYDELEKQIGQKIDWENVRIQREEYRLKILLKQKILPGVIRLIHLAKRNKLKLAIASSSPESWVKDQLTRLGLINNFDLITTTDDTGVSKPDPAIYNLTLKRLSIKPKEAIAFEDSPSGARAAESAGILCIKIPNEITRMLKFDNYIYMFKSLNHFSLRWFIS